MVSHSRHGLHRLRDLVNHDQQGFATNVYARLFSIEPGLRDLFGPSMTETRGKFAGVIDHVLEAIPAPGGQDELVEFWPSSAETTVSTTSRPRRTTTCTGR